MLILALALQAAAQTPPNAEINCPVFEQGVQIEKFDVFFNAEGQFVVDQSQPLSPEVSAAIEVSRGAMAKCIANHNWSRNREIAAREFFAGQMRVRAAKKMFIALRLKSPSYDELFDFYKSIPQDKILSGLMGDQDFRRKMDNFLARTLDKSRRINGQELEHLGYVFGNVLSAWHRVDETTGAFAADRELRNPKPTAS